MLSLPVIIWEDSRTNWLSVSEVNNSTIKRMYQFLGQKNAQNVCISERYECCPPRLDICQTRRTINTSGRHLLTTRIVVMTQRERDASIHRHTYTLTYTHTNTQLGASSFKVVCQLCFEACSAFSWLLCHSSFFQHSVRAHAFVCSSTHPNPPNCMFLLE